MTSDKSEIHLKHNLLVLVSNETHFPQISEIQKNSVLKQLRELFNDFFAIIISICFKSCLDININEAIVCF